LTNVHEYRYNIDILEYKESKDMTNRELKSKVVSMANKLSAKMGGNKSAAFTTAWATVKAGSLEIAVRGVTFGNRQEALKRLAKYAPEQIRAVIVPEPENAADKEELAVMVGVNNGRGLYRLGYVPRELCAVVSSFSGSAALRVVYGTWGRCGETFGARVALAV
jgi:hypothetical protein